MSRPRPEYKGKVFQSKPDYTLKSSRFKVLDVGSDSYWVEFLGHFGGKTHILQRDMKHFEPYVRKPEKGEIWLTWKGGRWEILSTAGGEYVVYGKTVAVSDIAKVRTMDDFLEHFRPEEDS